MTQSDLILDIQNELTFAKALPYSIPADSFNQARDMNIQPSLINVQTGGIPRHWSPSTRYSRIDLKNNQIAKSTSKMVKTFSEFIEESQAINNVFNK